MKEDHFVSTNSAGSSAERRQFLRRGGLFASGAVLGAAELLPQVANAAGNLPPETPVWTKTQGTGFLNPPYGLPSPFEKNVVRKLPATSAAFPTGSHTPLQNLNGTITPNGLFFERHHAGVPGIDPEAHLLMIHGLVARPLI